MNASFLFAGRLRIFSAKRTGFFYKVIGFCFIEDLVQHLETNTNGMTRQEEEYFATEWALQRMKLYDFRLPRVRQKQFEDYINGYSSRRNKVLGKEGTPALKWDE